ncbi:hypothetical protein HPP92_023000 [Vanilla planifolia]|uniref:Uncharacterized protein n=1 Tax=Vanilla planifolia TaxID=51239 RepID=A0A835PYK9_VANPL|nr:hypothetical protein HPP92_023266 [Vanilla planifolia]KAG0459872.1 hypothetical protein HPP92_023000 [Vanilla planifolia]
MKGEEGRMKRMESLGWLTESAVMPKKHKAIEGVGASSIVELKAQLYRTQEETRKTRDSAPDSSEFLRAKKKILPPDSLSNKNLGVEERAKRDKLELKATRDGSASYAALERKAELYEKLSRGELPDEEDKEKYCVDFFQKSLSQAAPPQTEENYTVSGTPHDHDDDKDDPFPIARSFGLGRTSSMLDSDDHKRFVREVHEEVNQAREKATMLKNRRQEQEAARREKLRQAYLRKQLEKLTSSVQKSATDGSL